jgi:hypothetical protein
MLDKETFKGGFAAGLLVALLDFGVVAYIPSFPFSALEIARLLEYWPMIAILGVIVLTGMIANIIGANRTWSGLTVGIGIGTGLFAILVDMGIVF